MNYQQMKMEQSKRHNENITKSGVFFAFNKEQLHEGIKKYPLSEGEKYVSIGMGGFIRKNQLNGFKEQNKVIQEWARVENKKIRTQKTEAEKAILYELNNYECFYSGDISDAMDVLKEQGYTREEVQKVFKKNYSRMADQL